MKRNDLRPLQNSLADHLMKRPGVAAAISCFFSFIVLSFFSFSSFFGSPFVLGARSSFVFMNACPPSLNRCGPCHLLFSFVVQESKQSSANKDPRPFSLFSIRHIIAGPEYISLELLVVTRKTITVMLLVCRARRNRRPTSPKRQRGRDLLYSFDLETMSTRPLDP